jgi:plasmid stabilization system protein ParE
MKLIVLNAAQAELEEAQVYYLQHATPGIAAAFVADYESGARRLLPVSPSRHRSISALAYIADASFSVLDRLSGDDDAITIRAIAHQRRRPGIGAGGAERHIGSQE